MNVNRKVAAFALAALMVTGALLSGCGAKAFEPFNDAPRTKVINDAPADVVTMPDGFSNAATKCDHGNRVYVAYHGDSPYASIFVVAADPSCAGK